MSIYKQPLCVFLQSGVQTLCASVPLARLPSVAFGRLQAAIIRMISNSIRIGMSHFEARSIPFRTPRMTTKWVMKTNKQPHINGRHISPENLTK